jgi:SAM-dependent methyltransferase
MRVTPQLYDLDPRDLLKRDIPFYLKNLDKSQRVLDIGVGTGRIAIQLAREGFQVLGIDPDMHMLSQAVAALSQEPSTVQSNIRLIPANIFDFRIKKKFGSVIFGYRTFQALIGRDFQILSLKNAAACLADNGRMIVSLPCEFDDISDDWKGNTTIDWVIQREGGIKISRRTERPAYDRNKRTLSLCLVYEVEFCDKSSFEICEPLTLAHISDADFRSLLPEAGLIIENAFGGYEEEPFGEGFDMIYVLKRKEESLRN